MCAITQHLQQTLSIHDVLPSGEWLLAVEFTPSSTAASHSLTWDHVTLAQGIRFACAFIDPLKGDIMTNNGTPTLNTEDKGNGRKVVTVGSASIPDTPVDPPVRRSVADARAASAQAPANDGNTAPLLITPDQIVYPDRTPMVEPQPNPEPTAPAADNQEDVIMSKRRFMPTRTEVMLPLGFMVLLGFLLAGLHSRVFGDSWAMTILVTLGAAIPAIFTVPAANRFIRSVKDRVPGNEMEPLMRLLLIIVGVLGLMVLALFAVVLNDRMQINWGIILYPLFVYVMTTGFACACSYQSEIETTKER